MIARRFLCRCVVAALVAVFALLGAGAQAQSLNARLSRAKQQILQGGPNQITETDQSAGRFVDSLFDNDAPDSQLSEVLSQALGRPGYKGAARRSTLRGRLVRNPDTENGQPPFVIVDRYGGVQRYIESVRGVDLEAYEGKIVGVRRDTGDTLLASQLNLPRTHARDNPVQLAGHEELIEPGEASEEGPLIVPEGVDPLYLDEGPDEGINFGGCPHCGGLVCNQSGCAPGVRGIFYARGEYLQWWFSGMDIPELVIEGTAIPGAPPQFNPTGVLFGGNEILDDSRDGGRILLGLWFDDQTRWAIEGDYLGFNDLDTHFSASGNGTTPIIGRPFIDALNGVFARQDVSFPGIQGTVTVDADSSFESAGLRLRHNLCCTEGCNTGCGDGVSCGSGICGGGICGGSGCGEGIYGLEGCNNLFRILGRGTRHTDVLYGIRYAQLDESLRVREDLEVIAADPPGGFPDPPGIGTRFDVRDNFSTSNEFVGGEVGFLWEWEYRRWSLELLSKLAIGNNQQKVVIHGLTTPTPPGTIVPDPSEAGGLLALRSNIGSYSQDELSVMPELGLTVGFALTQRLRLTAGYTFLYWSNVVRPGDQIDPVLDTTQIPRFNGISTTAILPRFVFHSTDLWAQGINLGADYRW